MTGPDDIGTEQITILATDDTGGTGVTSFQVLVKRNFYPIITTPFSDLELDVGTAFSSSFAGSFFDANVNPSDELSYAISGQPSWFNLDSANE